MAEWVPRSNPKTDADTAPPKAGGVLHTLTLRPGEQVLHKATPSHRSNFGLFFALLATLALHAYAVIATGSLDAGVWGLGMIILAVYFYVNRALPFWYVTDERVVQVSLTNSGTFEETSVDLNRVTSVTKHDPLFSSLFHLRRLDIFLAEGRKPKLTIRYQRSVDDLANLLNPSRR